jgi:hypothetical protein
MSKHKIFSGVDVSIGYPFVTFFSTFLMILDTPIFRKSPSHDYSMISPLEIPLKSQCLLVRTKKNHQQTFITIHIPLISHSKNLGYPNLEELWPNWWTNHWLTMIDHWLTIKLWIYPLKMVDLFIIFSMFTRGYGPSKPP